MPRVVEVIIEGEGKSVSKFFLLHFPPLPKIKKNSHNNLIQLPFPFFGGCEKKVGDKLNRLPFFFPMGGGGGTGVVVGGGTFFPNLSEMWSWSWNLQVLITFSCGTNETNS